MIKEIVSIVIKKLETKKFFIITTLNVMGDALNTVSHVILSNFLIIKELTLFR